MHLRIARAVLITVACVAAAVAAPVGAFANLPGGWGAANDITDAVYAPSGLTGHFSEQADTDDVFKVYLYEGDRLEAVISRGAGTGADVYLYPPGTTTVNQAGGSVAHAAPSATDADVLGLEYVAVAAGWHFIDVNVPSSGAEGDYTLYFSADSRDTDTGAYDTGAPPGIEIFSPAFDGLIDRDIDSDDVYWINLYAGENFTAKLTAYGDWDDVDLDMYFYRPGAPSVGEDANGWVVSGSKKRGSSSERFSYTPSTAGDYLLDIYAYAAGCEYKVNYACLTKPSVSSTLKAGRTYKVSSVLYPKRTAGTKPVTIVCERIKGGKATKSFSAKASTSGYSSKCTASVRLAKGTWRIKAKRTDATLGTFYSGYKTVTVK